MAFEVIEPGKLSFAEPLGEGRCSIGKGGALACRAADLEIVGITHYAIVLADAETTRLALRAVRDGEQQQSVAVSIVSCGKGAKRHDSGRRRINVLRALRRLAVTAEAAAGRYDFMVKGDELLIVNLIGEHVPAAEVRRCQLQRAVGAGRELKAKREHEKDRGRRPVADSVGGRMRGEPQ